MTRRRWDKYFSTPFPLLLSEGRGEERCHLRCRHSGDGGGAGNSKGGGINNQLRCGGVGGGEG